MGRYDLLPLDIGSLVGKQKLRSVSFDIAFLASVGIAEIESRSVKFEHLLNAIVQLDPCWFRGLSSLDNALNTNVLMYFDLIRRQNFEDNFSADVNAVKIMSRKPKSENSLFSTVVLNRKTKRASSYFGVLSSLVFIGFDKRRSIIATGLLGAFVDVISTREKSMEIDVEILPGSVLVVDCVNYVVYLDGVSVYRFRHGDWISISRDVVSMSVDSGTGGLLTGTLAYTERYL